MHTLIDDLFAKFARAAADVMDCFEFDAPEDDLTTPGSLYMDLALSITLGPRHEATSDASDSLEHTILAAYGLALVALAGEEEHDDPDVEETARVARIAWDVSGKPGDNGDRPTHEQLHNFIRTFLKNHPRSQFVMNIRNWPSP